MRNSRNFWRKYRWLWKCAEKPFLTEKLIHYFRQIPDYRCDREKRHDLAEMLVCVTIGFLCGRTTIRRSLNWCKNNLEWLRKHMELKYGIASPSTISRMLSGIDEELALCAFMEWIGEIVDSKNTHLAIDGKALCGATEKTKCAATPMILNVVETVRGLLPAQLPVDSKTNEIAMIPELLNLLDISGSIITIDAIGTQTAIMEQIHEQEGHFVLTVKKNQPEAYEEIHTFMDKLEAEAAKKKKGEIPEPVGAGKDIPCTALISDLILTAEELGSIKRMHWSIENRLHHVLDDTFREDRSPAKKSRNNLALIRKYAYNILRLAMHETGITNIMTEMMDCFCDNADLREQYVFKGIAGLY